MNSDSLETELDEVRAVAERALGPNLVIEIHDDGLGNPEKRFSIVVLRYDDAGHPRVLHHAGGWDRVSRALLRARAELEQAGKLPG